MKIFWFYSYIISAILLYDPSISAQNFWGRTNGPYAGNIYTIAIDEPMNLLYCGTWDGGIFRSRDNGEHWDETNNGILNGFIYSMTVANNGIVFAGNTTGILKSTDFGNNWQYCFDTPIGWIISFAINSIGNIYAGTNYGNVYRSTDNGINWSEIYNDGHNWIYSIAIDSSDNIFLCTSYNGILYSDNDGLNWTEKNNGFKNPVAQSIALQPITGKLFVGASDGVYISEDSGENWNRIDSSLNVVKPINFLSTGELIANTFFSLWISEDQGLSWRSITEGTEVETQAIKCCIINNQDEIFSGNAGDGIYFSSDKGTNWSFRANGITNVQFKSMVIDNDDNIYVGTFYAGISKSTDKGLSFTRVNSCIDYPYILSLGSNENNDIFAGSSSEGIYRTTNGGFSWQSINTGLENSGIYSILTNTVGNIYLGTGGGVYRSTNNGESWHKRGFNNSKIECFAIDSSNNLLIGVYDFTNPLEPKANLFRSTNEGLNWQNLFETYNISAVHVSKNGHYYVATGYSIYQSSDNGQNWSQSAVPNQIYTISSNADNHLFIGTNNGVYRSTDQGISWNELSTGLPNSVRNIPCLSFDSQGFIYIGVTNFTMYKSIESTTSVEDNINQINDFLLQQNYPNPFNPSTRIQYAISNLPTGQAGTQFVTLIVYDLLGREVTTLVNEEKPAGSYNVEFNLESSIEYPSSGVFFYRLQAGNYVETRKMILLK